MPTNWKHIALIAVAAGLTMPGADAAEFPILGIFGDPKNDGCKSVRAEEEGAYVAFNKSGQTGENGEGGCRYSKIESVTKTRYRLTGTCSSLEGKPTKTRLMLIIADNDHVVYGGTRYVRCR